MYALYVEFNLVNSGAKIKTLYHIAPKQVIGTYAECKQAKDRLNQNAYDKIEIVRLTPVTKTPTK